MLNSSSLDWKNYLHSAITPQKLNVTRYLWDINTDAEYQETAAVLEIGLDR